MKSTLRTTWRIFLVAFLALLAGILTNNLSSVSPAIQTWVNQHWIETGFVTFALIGFGVWLETNGPDQKSSAPTDVRARFLNLVRTYLENVLEARLKDVGHTLALEAQSGALIDQESATERVEQNTEALRQGALQPTINLIEAGHSERLSDGFLKSQGNADMQRLLILGNPGAGKSVVLTKLALEMVRAAQDKPGSPVNVQKSIPVLLNLAGWGASKQSLEDWIATETAQVYGLGSGAVQYHLQRNDLALLLDGLDELNETDQAKCVTEINKLMNGGQSGNLAISVIVCSRAREYGGLLADQKKLELADSWQLQALSDAQIDQYLKRVGPTANGLRNALKTGNPSSAALQELVRVPLYLQVATVALQGVDVSQVSPETLKETLWRKYVDRMFDRATREAERVTPKMAVVRLEPYIKVEAMRYLAFLGAMMKRQGLSELYLERLQPVFLPHSTVVQFRWIVGWVFGLVNALTNGLMTGWVFSWSINSNSAFYWTLFTVLFGSAVGLANGLAVGFFRALKASYNLSLFIGLLLGFISGLTDFLENGLVDGLRIYHEAYVFNQKIYLNRLTYSSLYGGFLGMFFGFFIGLAVSLMHIYKRTQPENIQIKPVELYSWSFSRFKFSFFRTIINELKFGLFYGLSFIFVFSFVPKNFGMSSRKLDLWAEGILFGIIGALIVGLSRALVNTWNTDIVPTSKLNQTNEGIRRTVKYAVVNGFLGAFFGIFLSLIGYFWKLGNAKSNFLADLLLVMPVWVAIIALTIGLEPVLRHFALRLTLWRANLTPRNYVHFLNTASDMLLLSRRGGGYTFIHQELRDYFAHLAETDSSVLPAHLLPPERQP